MMMGVFVRLCSIELSVWFIFHPFLLQRWLTTNTHMDNDDDDDDDDDDQINAIK